MGVGDPSGGIEKDAGVMVGRIQMEVPDDFFRRVVEVAMDESEKPDARYEDQPSLGTFKEGDHPQTDGLRTPAVAAIWIFDQFFPVRRIQLSVPDSKTVFSMVYGRIFCARSLLHGNHTRNSEKTYAPMGGKMGRRSQGSNLSGPRAKEAKGNENPVQTTAFFGVKMGFRRGAVDAGFPLQYDDLPLGRALSSAG